MLSSRSIFFYGSRGGTSFPSIATEVNHLFKLRSNSLFN